MLLDKQLFFIERLEAWYASNHRPLPWKGEKNPYLVWLSEIILQQTRVEQGLPYFERFKGKYPTVGDLAQAPEDEVMKLWEGLGYYSRAKNLHAAAKYIAVEREGMFPTTFDGLRALKGVGDYTAAAIASFAFGLPHAVVDGNVYRVLGRFFGLHTPIDSTDGKKLFAKLGQALIETAISAEHGLNPFLPGDYNQAMMDFGATHCTPALPQCPTCPLRPNCTAFQQKSVDILPVKSKKLDRKTRFFHYLVINIKDEIFIQRREKKDIWQNLYDFPCIEMQGLADGPNSLFEHESWKAWMGPASTTQLLRASPPYRQDLTHQRIVAVFWEWAVNDDFVPKDANWLPMPRKNWRNFAFPKIILSYFQQKYLPLELF